MFNIEFKTTSTTCKRCGHSYHKNRCEFVYNTNKPFAIDKQCDCLEATDMT